MLTSKRLVNCLFSQGLVNNFRFSSTSNKKGAAVNKITEDSDFAFRKSTVETLPFADQDVKFYPTYASSVKVLSEGVNDYEKLRIPDFRKIYNELTLDTLVDKENDPHYILSGKITSIRKAGKGSIFIDVVQDYKRVQFIIHHKTMGLDKEEFIAAHNSFRPGDQIMGIGKVAMTKVGELSLKLVRPLKLVSPALHPLPPKFNDIGKINRNRVIDYLVNKESVEVMLLRFKVIQLIRNFLEMKGFIGVETPIICSGNSGANATPFETSSQHIDTEEGKMTLSLRVAPELWLKKLIIAGFDKVYEIGKVFRNEGIDSTHNAEFTTCEFYQTFIGLEELMEISEEMLKFILNSILQDPKLVKFHAKSQELSDLINANNGRFNRIEFLPELEKQTGHKLEYRNLNKAGLIEYWKMIGDYTTDVSTMSESELINNLSEKYVESQCINSDMPTFIYNIPEIVSPLSKSNSNGVSHRFEMYINGREYMNAYEEENNPFKQRYKFNKQLQNREDGDMESLVPDERFVEVMEWAMPPTGGWGLGIDRLVMKLSSKNRIENVLPFGKLSDVVKQ
ncbi:hypothetical protein CANINC_001155 [Pichia inconspicua]|uniref:lysine--tRNA ligase n=1 Tax=Pichia inconspicua TaxID=52247 RepID=A0A4T0X4R6_9ASCO|nr:hypothetical protein CANINC_001155 [[Candida] inconspicua]